MMMMNTILHSHNQFYDPVKCVQRTNVSFIGQWKIETLYMPKYYKFSFGVVNRFDFQLIYVEVLAEMI